MNSKYKFMLLLLSFVIALFICHKFAFSKTISLKSEYDGLLVNQKLNEQFPRELAILKKYEKHFDSVIGKYEFRKGSTQNTLLEYINSQIKESKIRISEFNEPHIIEEDQAFLKTFNFTLEGGYKHLINILYNLETKLRIGTVENVQFERKYNFKEGKNYLYMKVFMVQVNSR